MRRLRFRDLAAAGAVTRRYPCRYSRRAQPASSRRYDAFARGNRSAQPGVQSKQYAGEDQVARYCPAEKWDGGAVTGGQSSGGFWITLEPQPASEVGEQEKLHAVYHTERRNTRHAFGASQPTSQPHRD